MSQQSEYWQYSQCIQKRMPHIQPLNHVRYNAVFLDVPYELLAPIFQSTKEYPQ